MKRIYITLILLLTTLVSQSQVILFQDFNEGNAPGWEFSNGASVGLYHNAQEGCADDYGVITPAVGGNNPARLLSQIITPHQPIVEVKFSIFRYNSNLTCNSLSPFACNTYVDILFVDSAYNGTDPIGDGAVIYANYSGYLLPIAGGNVSLNVTFPASLPKFRVYFNFSTTMNCNQPGTKYVLDKFYFTDRIPCQISNTCPPEANDDYFNDIIQSFTNSTLLANVYGTNLAYSPYGAHLEYVTRSLTHATYAPLGGNDFDIEEIPLNLMTFTLLSRDFSTDDADFTFNNDGTFSFKRSESTPKTVFIFTYRLTAPNGLYDDAQVRIVATGPLPVLLESFQVVKTSNGLVLNWKTSQEVNNLGFDILRKTGAQFEVVANVPTKAPGGNSVIPLQYSFTDNTHFTEKVVYYRLKQINIDGVASLSDIRAVILSARKHPVLIYPNPSPGDVTIVLPEEEAFEITVSDASGRRVQSIIAINQNRIVLKGLRTGIYLARIQNRADNSVTVQRIVIL